MRIGAFTIELLSEGRFELIEDGHINRVNTNTPFHQEDPSTTSTVVGINPVLVQTGSANLLIDAGLGWGLDAGSSYRAVSNIQTNLDIFGLDTDDISHVILSHLHYDHAAGSSFVNEKLKTQPTFPNAAYYVHQKEWKYAVQQAQKGGDGAMYQLDELYRLKANNRFQLLTEEVNAITEGVETLLSGGHTPGHQVVHLQSEEESGYYLGDLLPSSSHLNTYKMQQLDTHPIAAKKKKVLLRKKALRQQAVLLFYHSKTKQAGRLIRDNDEQYVLADIAKNPF